MPQIAGNQHLIANLQMETLQERRTKARLTMAYKILNGHVILEANLLPKSRIKPTHRKCNAANVGIDNELIEPTARLQCTEKTFFYSIEKLRNEKITSVQASAPSV